MQSMQWHQILWNELPISNARSATYHWCCLQKRNRTEELQLSCAAITCSNICFGSNCRLRNNRHPSPSSWHRTKILQSAHITNCLSKETKHRRKSCWNFRRTNFWPVALSFKHRQASAEWWRFFEQHSPHDVYCQEPGSLSKSSLHFSAGIKMLLETFSPLTICCLKELSLR